MASLKESGTWLMKNPAYTILFIILLLGSLMFFSLAMGGHNVADKSETISTIRYPFYQDHMSHGEKIMVECETRGGTIDILIHQGLPGTSDRPIVQEWRGVSSGTYTYTVTREGYHTISLRSTSGIVDVDYVIKTSGGNWRTPNYIAFGMGIFLIMLAVLSIHFIRKNINKRSCPIRFEAERQNQYALVITLAGVLSASSNVVAGASWSILAGLGLIIMGLGHYQLGRMGNCFLLYTEMEKSEVAILIAKRVKELGMSMARSDSSGILSMGQEKYILGDTGIEIGLRPIFLQENKTMIWVGDKGSPMVHDLVDNLSRTLECL